MIDPPFEYALSGAELQKLGTLSLTWAQTDDLIGQSLRRALGFGGDEATVMVYPLSQEQRIQRLKKLVELKPQAFNDDAKCALQELSDINPVIQLVRNNVVHAVVISDKNEGALFHLRSKDRTLTKTQVFELEELTNYACHVALSLRFALGDVNTDPWHKPLPDRPQIPDQLRHLVPNRKK